MNRGTSSSETSTTLRRAVAALTALLVAVGMFVIPTPDASAALDSASSSSGSDAAGSNEDCDPTDTTVTTTTEATDTTSTTTTTPEVDVTIPATVGPCETTTSTTTTTSSTTTAPTTTKATTTTKPGSTTTTTTTQPDATTTTTTKPSPTTTTTAPPSTTTTTLAPPPSTLPDGNDAERPIEGPADDADNRDDEAGQDRNKDDDADRDDSDKLDDDTNQDDDNRDNDDGDNSDGHEDWDNDDRDGKFGDDGEEVDGFVYEMLWPILGGGYIGSPFGAPRDGGARSHMGNDLMTDKLQPIVAVADGVVFRSATDSGISGTIVGVRHDDGWSSYYIHLNNDRYNTDDGRGVGIRPGIEVGARVKAGELIGWIGDSGNAEGTVPHLHFELHTPSGQAIDPEASLRTALRKAEWPNLPKGAKSFDGAYWDDDGSPVETLVDTLVANQGIVLGCGKGGFTLCAQDEVTSDDLRGLLKRLNPPIGTALANLDKSTLFQSATTDSAAGLSASIGSIQVPEVVTEADIARIAAAESDFDRTRIASLYATTNSTKTALASLPRGVETYAAGEALDILQRDGVLGKCIESLDDTKPVNRADAISLIAQTSNQLPGPCGGPSDDGGAIIPPGPAVERWRPLVEEYFPKKRVEEAMRVLACESRGNPNAVNPTSNATGLFQFIPTTWMWASAAAGYGGYDRTHPEANVASAAWLTVRDEARGVDAWSAWECKP